MRVYINWLDSHLAKVEAEGSSPFTRSNYYNITTFIIIGRKLHNSKVSVLKWLGTADWQWGCNDKRSIERMLYGVKYISSFLLTVCNSVG